MKNLTKYFLNNKAFSWLILCLFLIGGVLSYVQMGKLEDAPFTIKQAVVTTPYPGASAQEVQEQVTDKLEESIQSLGELYYLKSDNRAGMSKITVYVKKEIRANEMQQLWDKLRRKVNDVQNQLPEGAGPSVVNDDFGDVLGVFYGLSSPTHSYRDMDKEAKKLKDKLLSVQDVARVEIFGLPTPVIELEVNPSVLSQSGITLTQIAQAFEQQNKIVDAGGIETSTNRIRIDTRGVFSNLEEIRQLTITGKDGSTYRLADIAQIHESYSRTPRNAMYLNNQPAIGLAISTVSDGNVVDMAIRVKEVLEEAQKQLPEGYLISPIYDQGHESDVANQGFIINLILSVITVVAVLLFFIGIKNGFLIGSGLIFSIFGTLIYMNATGIALQRMSLAAIIIAMGMLVDNAIVVYDSALINMERGMRKRPAILKAVSTGAMPLLGATLIAILTFLPVYLSPHITGEILSSLFLVIAVSLFLSWVLAITQNVFFIQEFVRRPKQGRQNAELFSGKYYDGFRKLLRGCIRHRYPLIAVLVGLLYLSYIGFQTVPKQFMPLLNKQYFTMEIWLPEGTSFDRSRAFTYELTDSLSRYPHVRQLSSFIGQTPPRFYLANTAYGPQSNYAQILVETDTPEEATALRQHLEQKMPAAYPEALIKVNSFEINSIPQALIEARFCGPDPAVLDSLTQVALEVMRKNPHVVRARNEWGNMAPKLCADYNPVKGGKIQVQRQHMMQSVKSIHDGVTVGVFRDENDQVPVMLYCSSDTEPTLAELRNWPVWNGKQSAPLAQVTDSIHIQWEYPLMRTYNRQLSMAAQCDVAPGHTMSEVHSEIRDEIEKIRLPEGYSFFWDSQFKDQGEAMEALFKYFPLALVALIVILVALFRNFRQPLIIFLVLPLSVIGVVFGLCVTGFQFGFFCIAGWLGLLGMIIKNVIVLLDETNSLKGSGLSDYQAIIEATVSRARPVLMAALTTVFGSIPLLFDVAFGGMAATIVFGLTFATLLTLVVTPVLYCIFYRVSPTGGK